MNFIKYLPILAALAAIMGAYFQYKQWQELHKQTVPCNCHQQNGQDPSMMGPIS